MRKLADLLVGHGRVSTQDDHQLLLEDGCVAIRDGLIVAVGPTGACAGMILVDYEPPTPIEADDLSAHIHFGLSGRAVVTTIRGGQIVMKDRQIVLVDESEVESKSRAAAARLWQRF